MRPWTLLLLAILAVVAVAGVRGNELDDSSELESAFLELQSQLQSMIAEAESQDPSAAPLAPPPPSAPTEPKFTKPVIDPRAALDPAPAVVPHARHRRHHLHPGHPDEIKPVMVPYSVPAKNSPITGVAPDNLVNATIDRRYGHAEHRHHWNEAVVTFGPDAPANYTKAKISKNIHGSTEVHYHKAIDHRGCPCRKPVHKKYRYDTEFKPKKVKYSPKCCCKHKKHKKHRERLPVVAEIKVNYTRIAEREARRRAKACKRKHHKRKHGHATVREYYPEKRKRRHKHGCNSTHHRLHKRRHVTPEFKRGRRLTREERKKLREVVLVPAGQLP